MMTIHPTLGLNGQLPRLLTRQAPALEDMTTCTIGRM